MGSSGDIFSEEYYERAQEVQELLGAETRLKGKGLSIGMLLSLGEAAIASKKKAYCEFYSEIIYCWPICANVLKRCSSR